MEEVQSIGRRFESEMTVDDLIYLQEIEERNIREFEVPEFLKTPTSDKLWDKLLDEYKILKRLARFRQRGILSKKKRTLKIKRRRPRRLLKKPAPIKKINAASSERLDDSGNYKERGVKAVSTTIGTITIFFLQVLI